jgi:hypothetical protein
MLQFQIVLKSLTAYFTFSSLNKKIFPTIIALFRPYFVGVPYISLGALLLRLMMMRYYLLWRQRVLIGALSPALLHSCKSDKMDPVTMGLLKLGVHLMKNVAVVDNVNAATRFFLSFDSNGDKELDPDEIAAALEVLLFFKHAIFIDNL